METINYVEITVDFPILRVLYTEIVVMISLFEIILIKVLLFIIEIKLIIIMSYVTKFLINLFASFTSWHLFNIETSRDYLKVNLRTTV